MGIGQIGNPNFLKNNLSFYPLNPKLLIGSAILPFGQKKSLIINDFIWVNTSIENTGKN
jgi:hypothetical protein